MSTLVTSAPGESTGRLRVNMGPLLVALLLILAGAFYLTDAVSGRQAGLWVLGVLLGVTLYHSAFGFTHAWRAFIADRRGDGLRAQMLMLALGVVLFFPVLAQGSFAGQSVNGFIMPPGVSVLLGAFLFGIGMQLGGGCASGTLFSAGGGSTRMMVTLVFFIAGSVLGAMHYSWWSALPALAPVSLIKSFGLWPALLGNLAVFAAIAVATLVLEKRRHGGVVARTTDCAKAPSLLTGPWPLIWGSVALVVLNFATLLVAGRPWGITNAFTIWGSKILYEFDIVDPTEWAFWIRDLMPMVDPVSKDITSVMNGGLVLGALAAAAAAGRFAPVWRIPVGGLLASAIGGVLLGYGSRMAFGCNISAYFSGILSGSLHAWLWLPAAFAGNLIGVRMRPWFGLTVEKLDTPAGC